MRGRWFSLALLVFACVALFGGLTWLVQMRFESGEVYPRGSSLRADPLGSKALYASFEALESIEVSRNFVPFDQLEQLEPDASVLLLNLHGAGMHGLVQNERIERFVEQGGRLVCALNANTVAYKYLTEEDEDRDTSDEMREPVDDREQAVFKRKAKERTERFWAGLNLIHGEHEGGDAEIADAALVTDLPPRIPWREGGRLLISKPMYGLFCTKLRARPSSSNVPMVRAQFSYSRTIISSVMKPCSSTAIRSYLHGWLVRKYR